MSQAAMPASARAMFSRAKARAFSARESPCRRETSWAMRFQWPGGVAVPGRRPRTGRSASARGSDRRVAGAEGLDALERVGVVARLGLGRPLLAELVGGAHGEGRHAAPTRQQGPLPRREGLPHADAGREGRAGRAGGQVARPEPEDGVGGLLADADPLGLGRPSGTAARLAWSCASKVARCAGIGRREDAMRRRRGRRGLRGVGGGLRPGGVRLVGRGDGVDGIVDGHVDHRHVPRRDRRGRLVDADGVQEDVVPPEDLVGLPLSGECRAAGDPGEGQAEHGAQGRSHSNLLEMGRGRDGAGGIIRDGRTRDPRVLPIVMAARSWPVGTAAPAGTSRADRGATAMPAGAGGHAIRRAPVGRRRHRPLGRAGGIVRMPGRGQKRTNHRGHGVPGETQGERS
jgi:hypothetical protein